MAPNAFKAPQRRTFKACRPCRQQKVRCEGADGPSCRRCQATGRVCVFDEIFPKARRQLATEDHHLAAYPSSPYVYPGLPDPTSMSSEVLIDLTRIQIFAPSSHALRSPTDGSYQQSQVISGQEQQGATSRSNSRDQGQTSLISDSPSSNSAQILSPSMDNSGSRNVNLLQLEAPLAAVHAMETMSDPNTTPHADGNSPSQAGTSPQTSFPNRDFVGLFSFPSDALSPGLIPEPKARQLFHTYMAGANVFMPLFDPVTDSFEALRERSTFCLTVILAIALHTDRDTTNTQDLCRAYVAEAKSLAAQTLFSDSPKVEDVQALILLAAYSEKNWFAINHARQMAEDMNFHHMLTLPEVKRSGSSDPNQRRFRGGRASQVIRTMMVLFNVEQEVASGTGRPSKVEPVNEQVGRLFLKGQYCRLLDTRIVSTAEMTQLRGRHLRQIETSPHIQGTLNARLESPKKEVDSWFNYWDEAYANHDFNTASFPRSSLRAQKQYAMIIICSAMISKLGRQLFRQSDAGLITEELAQMIKFTITTATGLLEFVMQNDAYKWHLQYGPTYMALFPVFTAALLLKLALLRTNVVNWNILVSSCSIIGDILEHAYPKYASLLRDLARAARAQLDMERPPDPSTNIFATPNLRAKAQNDQAHDGSPFSSASGTQGQAAVMGPRDIQELQPTEAGDYSPGAIPALSSRPDFQYDEANLHPFQTDPFDFGLDYSSFVPLIDAMGTGFDAAYS